MRASGILLPVTSLPSPYGIGCFSKEAYEFVDQLEKGGEKYWQILPLGPTGYGDSPYQSFSTYAGNPYFIDLETLIEEGLLTKEECDQADFGENEEEIDYEKIYNARFKVLKLAYARAKKNGLMESKAYRTYLEEEKAWLSDYALYMAVKDSFDGKSWDQLGCVEDCCRKEKDIRLRKPEAIAAYQERLSAEIDFYEFLQYLFAGQWAGLKAYANEQGIEIIGDIPIYVAFDSADTWANPKLFQLDEENLPVAVAGCPPDAFSATGQLWGNPLYAWDYHKKTGYDWWMKRVACCFKLYDIIRIDHFRGFDEYYAIPYGDETAENGEWMPGPGMDLFRTMKETLGNLPIIAEDLGFLTDTVRQLLKDSGYPGMKVLEFAFGGDRKNPHLPHNYTQNCVVYGGTHDNETLMGYFIEHPDWELGYAYDYLDTRDKERMVDQVFRAAYGSVANLVIFAVQDILKLGNWARMNTPSTLGTNWKWRMKKGELNDSHIKDMRYLASVFGRENS